MNTILAANAVVSTATNYAGGYGGNAVRTGASVVPASKAFNQNVASVFASEQKPVTRVRIAEQGSTTDFLVVAHYGPCVEQPDHHDQPVLEPYAGAAFRDDFDLPIAGHPAPGQAGNMFQNAPGNSFNLGILSTSPPGVTSPAIPNTGDVTPGTAGANPAAYVTAPLKKQHPWITDVVTGHALMQTAYGDYDYTDPTGSVHTSLGKGDTHVKKPKLDVKLSTNTTAPYLLSVADPLLTPTQYPDSGCDFSLVADGGNDGIRVRTKYGTGDDAENTVIFKIQTQTSAPATGDGDQTARAFPGYDGTVYNTAALDYDPTSHAAFVKRDVTTIDTDVDGKLRVNPAYAATLGGGGGGVSGTGAANYGLSSDWSVPFLGFGSTNYVPWNALINGDNVYLDGSHTDGLTIPADGGGDYLISANLWVDSFIHDAQQWSIEYVLSIELWRAGTQVLYIAKEDLYQQADGDGAWYDINFDTTAAVTGTQPGDVVKIGLQVAGGGPGWRSAVTLYGFTTSPTSGNYQHVTIAPVGVSGRTRRAGNYTIDSNLTSGSWSSPVYIPWNECINGSSAYLDIANTDGLTVPAGGDGDYSISATLRIDASPGGFLSTHNWSIETVLSIQLWRSGTQLMYVEQQELYQNQTADGEQFWSDPTFKIDAVVPETVAGDVIKIGLTIAGGEGIAGGGDFYVWGGWAGSAGSPDATGGWETWLSIAPVG